MSETYAALITSYNGDETINFDNTRLQIQRQISNGNHILCCGTNGDFSSLLTGEKKRLVEISVEEAEGKSGVIANAGCPSTFQTLKLAGEFASIGVDAVAVITPYFISCTQDGLYEHYMRLADSIRVPVYIYDIPARTQNGILPETVEKLASHENIAGIKDSSGKVEHLEAYCAMADDNFRVYCGTDSLILHGLKSGSSGCVSGLANIVPDWVNSIVRNFDLDNQEEAEQIQKKLLDFRTELYTLGYGPALVKRSVYVMDPSVGNNRMPSLVPGQELDSQISALLDKYDISYR
ncbi:MAG: dihydrodipicolinate synthase family protein [Spirochaetales bacterium]|nr:dihydrodipicolinate synthase family protein [Spirochaetales bacterium]